MNGKFGPFAGQLFIGDQGHSKVMRVFMEKVNGVYQGASFNFVEGFSSGIIRMIWGSDNSMFVGMTSRGWSSTGKEEYGLQRLVWNGKMPFEIKAIKARDDGFELEFTKPVNKAIAENPESYEMISFNYKYHFNYGSPIVDQSKGSIENVVVAADGMSVRLTIAGMRLGFIHQVKASKLKSTTGDRLLHDTGYYTLNEVPGGVLKSKPTASMLNAKKGIAQPKRVNEMPLTWLNGVDEKLVLGTKPGLKYDVAELVVNANSKIELTFNNNDDMLHNVVITQRGVASVDKVGDMGAALGLDGANQNYVPDSDLVLYHTGIVEPGNAEKIYFQAPNMPGEYWIVCTFPGHAKVMRAKLIVKASS